MKKGIESPIVIDILDVEPAVRLAAGALARILCVAEAHTTRICAGGVEAVSRYDGHWHHPARGHIDGVLRGTGLDINRYWALRRAARSTASLGLIQSLKLRLRESTIVHGDLVEAAVERLASFSI